MILGILVGFIFMVLLILAYAAGYVQAAQKIKPQDEEQDLDDR